LPIFIDRGAPVRNMRFPFIPDGDELERFSIALANSD
jgi:hypothetical protein